MFTRDQQFMMLSYPNSGTTWLAQLLAKHSRGLDYYDKEFFNPVCNPLHRERIAEGFGAEWPSYYSNIMTSDTDPEHAKLLDEIYDETWPRYTWNFDKEVWCAYKVGFYAKHFTCFALIRKPGSSFPPKRAAVLYWYDSAYKSAVENGLLPADPKSTLFSRAMRAHALMNETMVKRCKEHDIPIFDFDDIMFAPAESVERWLLKLPIAPMMRLGDAVREIVATRTYPRRPWQEIV